MCRAAMEKPVAPANKQIQTLAGGYPLWDFVESLLLEKVEEVEVELKDAETERNRQ